MVTWLTVSLGPRGKYHGEADSILYLLHPVPCDMNLLDEIISVVKISAVQWRNVDASNSGFEFHQIRRTRLCDYFRFGRDNKAVFCFNRSINQSLINIWIYNGSTVYSLRVGILWPSAAACCRERQRQHGEPVITYDWSTKIDQGKWPL